MRNLFLSILTPIVAVVASGGVLAQQKLPAEPALVVNGKPIDSATRVINGKTYVDIESISKLLGVSITKSNGVIVIESNGRLQQQATPSGPGSISGSLSYLFNRNYGNRSDTGSNVYLLNASQNFDFNSEDVIVVFGDKVNVIRGGIKTEFLIAFETAADGNGKFEFKSVPPGTYTLFAISAHARGSAQSDVGGKTFKRVIEIKEGSTSDASHDFGMSQF